MRASERTQAIARDMATWRASVADRIRSENKGRARKAQGIL